MRFNQLTLRTISASLLAATLVSGCRTSPTRRETAQQVAGPEMVRLDESSAEGVAWEFKPENGDWQPIQVPAGGWRAQGFTCDAGTYRTWLQVPAGLAGQRVQLAFDAINFGAEILAAPDAAHLVSVARHVDGWVPVTVDLTRWAQPGQKMLVQVAVAGRKKFMVKGKYTVPEGATWYAGLEEGILRGVHLEVVPAVRIEEVFVTTHVNPDTLTAAVKLVNDTEAEVSGEVAPALHACKRENFPYPALAPVRFTLAAHQRQTLTLGPVAWTAGAGSYWWPNVPYRAGYRAQLHDLELGVAVGGQTVQDLHQRFGFRQFQAVGNHYELNGVHINLRGDNQQEANFGTDAYGIKKGFGPPTRGNPGWPQAVDNWERLNFNVMRIHQIPPTPYMLDVCDEKGLLIVEESPLRGSEQGESYADGKTNMLNMDRELVLRDRNHPAVVIWSAANEWKDPIRDAQAAIRELDPTRVIIADGVGEMGPDVINMEHYVSGISKLPQRGGKPRSDRPYGETEAVWADDNTLRGFAWMATSVRTRRLLGDADLRNYVLNNAWPNYVPGESNQTEILEKEVKHWNHSKTVQTILPDIANPWANPHIQLLQQCYHPLAACDVEFDQTNAHSNAHGDWPVVKPVLPAASLVTRKIAVFNDELFGNDLTLTWELRQGDACGPLLQEATVSLTIAPGEFRTFEIKFQTPANGEAILILAVHKNGHERFREDKIAFQIRPTGS